ncbi:DNA polymerase epsilon catalytic subunit A-like isoform X3 [Fagus crenata]
MALQPQSKLHDPALHRILHKVMQMVFALLLADFRKLGATIIFANFSKVIIDTGKFDLSAAKAYCDSLLKTLQNRDLFEWIELEPLNFCHSLLFMDQGIDTQDDTVSYINDALEEGNQISSFHKDKIGGDGNGTSYWYDGNKTIGYRLYRELMPFLFLRSFKRRSYSSFVAITCFGVWQVCTQRLWKWPYGVGLLVCGLDESGAR